MPEWRDLAEGAQLPPFSFGPLRRTDFVRYQGASGDMNPVHHDEPFARDAGFPAPLAVGMFAAGVMNSRATAWLGAEHVRRTRIRWLKPAFPGFVLAVSGRVVRRYEEGEERRVDLELCVTDQDGDLSVQGWMTFVVPRSGSTPEEVEAHG